MFASSSPRILGPNEGETVGNPGVLHDRFMLQAGDTGGRFALVEHLTPPGVLAAPLHRHTREDEYSYVIEGRVGAVLGGEEVAAGPGALVFKPRGEWHTFWNAGDAPLRILELISPAGFEALFRELDALAEMDPAALAVLAARYGAEVDFEGTGLLMERHGLSF